MSLLIGSQVTAETLGWQLTIQKKLGEGGQGVAYLASGPGGDLVVKWYNAEQATDAQRQAIRQLVKDGPPTGLAGKRFVWPLDVVTAPQSRQFGYLMSVIDTQRFAELGDVWSRRKPAPGLAELCEISFQMANSYRVLHLRGMCYRDISKGNLMFDSRTGEVLICDNDNVGINRHSTCQVWGTMEYMAPELIRGEASSALGESGLHSASPSTETDLHSLAVLLFQLWVWHHPLHGELEYRCRCWDLPAKRRVYGETPVFVFDPQDRRNPLPNDPDYTTAARRWPLCPPSLQALFTKAFTTGLKEPASRVTEGEWQTLFRQLKDGVLNCGGCQAVNLWDATTSSLECWHCHQPIGLPPKLVMSRHGRTHTLLLSRTAKLRQRHVDPFAADDVAETILGEVTQHPTNPSIWGLRNLSSTPWVATSPDGSAKEVPPQKATSLEAGLKLNVAGVVAEVQP